MRSAAGARTACLAVVFCAVLLVIAPPVVRAALPDVGPEQPKPIAVVHGEDTALADGIATLLQGHGVRFALLTTAELGSVELSTYDGLVVCPDTTGHFGWLESSTAAKVGESGLPVVGMGQGGAGFFRMLGLSINDANAVSGTDGSVEVVDPSRAVFSTPHAIALPADNVLALYSTAECLGQNVRYLDPGVALLGREPGQLTAYTLAQETRYVFWGFSGGPSVMTDTGKDLFVNVVAGLLPDNRRPDLFVTDLWNDGGQAFCQVRNVGSGPASDPVIVVLEVDGTTIASVTVEPPLAVGERRTVSFTGDWRGQNAVSHVRATADPGGLVTELDETDNARDEDWQTDAVPPVVTAGPTVEDVMTDTATIVWQTDEDTRGVVVYGSGMFSRPMERTDEVLATSHRVTLSGLSAGTTYSYLARSTDGAGNVTSSRRATFATLPAPDPVAPVIARLASESAADSTSLSADISDNVAVTRVEFSLDGAPVFIDYSAPYEVEWLPEAIPVGTHQVGCAAVDPAGNEMDGEGDLTISQYAGHPVVTIASPAPGTQCTGVISVQVNASAELGLKWLHLWVDGQPKGYEDFPSPWPTAATYTFDLDTRSLENGAREIEVVAGDNLVGGELDTSGVARVTVNVWNEPKVSPPALDVTDRHVTRQGADFTVSLTVTNVGASAASGIYVDDELALFQPVGASTSDATYLPDVDPQNLLSSMIIWVKGVIMPGQSRTFTYHAVPYLEHPMAQTPAIGTETSLRWSSATQSGFRADLTLQTFNTDATANLASESIGAAYNAALKGSDYLLVTNPRNLLALNGRGDVSRLLSSMAELARIKNGALGYLDLAARFPRSLEPSDDVACGDVISGGRAEMVVGDVSTKGIYLCGVQDVPALVGPSGQQKSVDVSWFEREPIRPKSQSGAVVDFDHGDRLAVGYAGAYPEGTWTGTAWNGTSPTDCQVFMLDIATSSVYMLLREGWTQLAFQLPFAAQAGDALTAGDFDGDKLDEVAVMDASAHVTRVYKIVRQSGQPAAVQVPQSAQFAPGQLLACGDVNSDGKEELIIGSLDTDRISMCSIGGQLLKSFAYDLWPGDGLTCSHGRIVVANYVKGTISFYSQAGVPQGSPIQRAVSPGDDLVAGPVIDPGHDQIVTGDTKEDYLTVYDAGQGDQHLLKRLITFNPALGALQWSGTKLPNSSLNAIEIGAWSSRLAPSWVSDGYLLLVGETDIIPAWMGESFGNVVVLRGGPPEDWDLRALLTDYPYASTCGEEIVPELSIGRIIGNSAAELKKAVDVSVGVSEGQAGYHFDRGAALAVSGFPKGCNGTSGEMDFQTEAKNVQKALQQRSVPCDWIDTPDFGSVSAAKGAVLGALKGRDVVFLTGHGSPGSWDVLDPQDLLSQTAPFAGSDPFVFVSSCLTGLYTEGYAGRFSIANAFLSSGASVYVGATIEGLSTHAWIAPALYDHWLKSGVSIGRAVRDMKRVMTAPTDKYWASIYQVYGDPKFGATPGAANLASATADEMGAASARYLPASGSTTVDVQVPDLVVEHVEGTDSVSLPGGTMLMVGGRPAVPSWHEDYAVPQGGAVQAVRLLGASEPVQQSGLNLPPCRDVLAGTTQPGVVQVDEAAEWWPEQEFAWSVIEGPDGDKLRITVNPFQYNALTRRSSFRSRFTFAVELAASQVTAVGLGTDRSDYAPGDPVTVDLALQNGGAEATDVVVSGTLNRPGTDEQVAQVFLETLGGLRGAGAFSPRFDTAGLAPGDYELLVVLRDRNGVELDRITTGLRLGAAQPELTGLSATPSPFTPGQTVHLTASVHNAGSGAGDFGVRLIVRDAGGARVAAFTHDLGSLAAGASIEASDEWRTAGVAPGAYEVVAMASVGGSTTPPSSITIRTRPALGAPHCPASVLRGQKFAVYGTLKPHFTAGARSVKVTAYRYSSGKWRLYKSYMATNRNDGGYTRYSLALTLARAGTYRFKAFFAKTRLWAATSSGYSTRLRVR